MVVHLLDRAQWGALAPFVRTGLGLALYVHLFVDCVTTSALFVSDGITCTGVA